MIRIKHIPKDELTNDCVITHWSGHILLLLLLPGEAVCKVSRLGSQGLIYRGRMQGQGNVLLMKVAAI